MSAQQNWKNASRLAQNDGPTVPPTKGELDGLLDACGRRAPAVTLQVRKAELDSLKMLAVSVAIDPDEDPDAGRYMHMRVSPPSLPRLRSTAAEREANTKAARVTHAALMAASAAKVAAASANNTKKSLLVASFPPKGIMMWVPAFALAIGIAGMTAMSSSGGIASASSGVPGGEQRANGANAAAAPAPNASSAPANPAAVATGAPSADDNVALSPVVRHAVPVAPSSAAAAAPAVAFAGAVTGPTVVAAAPNAAASCESSADVGAQALSNGDYATAESAFARVHACNPGYLPARIGRADAAWASGDHARAAGLYRQIVDDVPADMVPPRVVARAGAAQ